MKFAFFPILLLTYLLPIQSATAEPNLCNTSATTIKEKEVVNILQELYLMQSNLKNTQNILGKLNDQISQSINRRKSDNIVEYNDLVNEYNRFINYSNETGQNYNKLKVHYNDLVNSISPSTNTALLNCLNHQKSRITQNMTGISIDYLRIEPGRFSF